jgi:hypothetical protein
MPRCHHLEVPLDTRKQQKFKLTQGQKDAHAALAETRGGTIACPLCAFSTVVSAVYSRVVTSSSA